MARKYPVDRKLLVAPTLTAGRELLKRLALKGDGWVGFEVTTPRPLALRLARPVMEREGLAALDKFEGQALLDEAMDAVMPRPGTEIRALVDGVGFRERVHGAIEAMRLAGVTSEALGRARLADWEKRRFLHRTLVRYEELLRERRRVDTAGILALGRTALEAEGGRMPRGLDASRVLLLPGLGTRGEVGRLLSELAQRGSKVLETDAVIGLDVPEPVLWKPGKSARARSYLHAPEDAPRSSIDRRRGCSGRLRSTTKCGRC